MKPRLVILLALGILLLLAGTVFTLQGMGILGPTNGFMYRSSTWIVNGSISAVVGLALIVLSAFLGRTPAQVKT